MTRTSSLLASAVLALVFGLVAAGTASADAPVTSETRSVAAFHAISVPGTLKVEITVGKPARVEVSGETDLLAKLTTTVKDGVLVIDTPKRMRGRNHLRATITVPELDAIELSGTAQVTAAGLAAAGLALRIPGTGSITVTGTTGTMEVAIDGTGEINADKLSAKDARVAIGGTGQASVRASQSVEVSVSGTGSVNIAGNPPRVKKSVTGTGSVHMR